MKKVSMPVLLSVISAFDAGDVYQYQQIRTDGTSLWFGSQLLAVRLPRDQTRVLTPERVSGYTARRLVRLLVQSFPVSVRSAPVLGVPAAAPVTAPAARQA